jgi:hypothetical protein
MKRIVLVALLTVAGACSSNPEPAPAPEPQATTPPKPVFDPIGEYDFSTTAQGQAVTGVIVIAKGENGALGGRISSTVSPDLPISTVMVEGTTVTLSLPIESDVLTMVLNFSGNTELTGNWSLAGDSGALNGKRKSGTDR